MGKVVSFRSDYFIFILLVEYLLCRRWVGNWVITVDGYIVMFFVFISEVFRFIVLFFEKLIYGLVIK